MYQAQEVHRNFESNSRQSNSQIYEQKNLSRNNKITENMERNLLRKPDRIDQALIPIREKLSEGFGSAATLKVLRLK